MTAADCNNIHDRSRDKIMNDPSDGLLMFSILGDSLDILEAFVGDN